MGLATQSLKPTVLVTSVYNKFGNIESEHYDVVFSYLLEQTPEEEDLWDHHLDLSRWIARAHDVYYKDFTIDTTFSSAVRTVNPEELANEYLSKVKSSEYTGTARINLRFTIQKHQEQSYFSQEMVRYELQFCDLQPNQLHTVFPIGYQTVYSYKTDQGPLQCAVAFDLRVTDDDIQGSMEWMIDTAIPGLKPYFNHIVEVSKEINGKPPRIDFQDVEDKLKAAVASHYTKRLQDPSFMERHLLFLEIQMLGVSETELHLSAHITARIETTSTPGHPVSHPDYAAVVQAERVFLHSFNRMTSEDVERMKELRRGPKGQSGETTETDGKAN